MSGSKWLLVAGVAGVGYWYITRRGTVNVPSGLPQGPIGPQPITGPTGLQAPGSAISGGEQAATAIAGVGGSLLGGPLGGLVASGVATGVGAINRELFPHSFYGGGGLDRARDAQAAYAAGVAGGANTTITDGNGGPWNVGSDSYIVTRDWTTAPGVKAQPLPTGPTVRDHRSPRA